MTIENCKRLIEHYKALIEDPNKAFLPSTVARGGVKPGARENVVKHAKKHLADMEENLKIREFIKANPDKKLNPATVLRKLSIPQEEVDKAVKAGALPTDLASPKVKEELEKEKTKKSK